MSINDKHKDEPNILVLNNSKYLRVVENMCNELNISEYIVYYQSRYNSYVRYDYEPFCADGFDVEFHFELNKYNIDRIKFMHFVYGQHLRNLEYLEKCFKENIKSKDSSCVWI